MRQRRFVQCDVFTSEPTKGNGLAVVVDANAGICGLDQPGGNDILVAADRPLGGLQGQNIYPDARDVICRASYVGQLCCLV